MELDNINRLDLPDKEIECVECGQKFLWTSGEQRYYLSKQLAEPKRCPECRKWRKATIIREVSR